MILKKCCFEDKAINGLTKEAHQLRLIEKTYQHFEPNYFLIDSKIMPGDGGGADGVRTRDHRRDRPVF